MNNQKIIKDTFTGKFDAEQFEKFIKNSTKTRHLYKHAIKSENTNAKQLYEYETIVDENYDELDIYLYEYDCKDKYNIQSEKGEIHKKMQEKFVNNVITISYNAYDEWLISIYTRQAKYSNRRVTYDRKRPLITTNKDILRHAETILESLNNSQTITKLTETLKEVDKSDIKHMTTNKTDNNENTPKPRENNQNIKTKTKTHDDELITSHKIVEDSTTLYKILLDEMASYNPKLTCKKIKNKKTIFYNGKREYATITLNDDFIEIEIEKTLSKTKLKKSGLDYDYPENFPMYIYIYNYTQLEVLMQLLGSNS